jgi:hypothetical protein
MRVTCLLLFGLMCSKAFAGLVISCTVFRFAGGPLDGQCSMKERPTFTRLKPRVVSATHRTQNG